MCNERIQFEQMGYAFDSRNKDVSKGVKVLLEKSKPQLQGNLKKERSLLLKTN